MSYDGYKGVYNMYIDDTTQVRAWKCLETVDQ